MKTATVDPLNSPKHRNIAHKGAYTTGQRSLAERVKIGLEMVYASTVVVKYCTTYISIKVETPRVVDGKNLKLLDLQYESDGIKKVVGKDNIVYRIPKQM